MSEVTDQESKLLVEIQIQLARIEKTLESVPMMAATLEAVKETARDAQKAAASAHQRLDVLGRTKEVADDAHRKAEAALQRLDQAEADQNWFKRTFYGAVIVAVGGALVTAIFAAINFAGT